MAAGWFEQLQQRRVFRALIGYGVVSFAVLQIEAAYAARGCAEANWMGPFGVPFGLAAQIVALGERLIACDPLKPTNYSTPALAAAWAGRPEQVLAMEAAEERATGAPPRASPHRIRALVALGRLDEAREQLRILTGGGARPATAGELFAAAAVGEDAASLRARLQRAPRATGPGDPLRVAFSDATASDWYFAALTGDRAMANRLSAAVDAGPAGPLLLVIRTGACRCGAPFDLDSTPNFKARLAESGLPWPPVEPPQTAKRAQGGGQ